MIVLNGNPLFCTTRGVHGHSPIIPALVEVRPMWRFARLISFFLALAAPAWAVVTPLPGASPQVAPAGQTFANPVSVRVTDAQGAPVPGAVVTWFLPVFFLKSSMQGQCDYESFFNYLCRVD